MNIQQLRYIVAIDRFRNFARAADACNISQPTLSAMLVKLEDELDVRIFDRTNKVVKPTTVGERIIRQAQKALMETNRINELITESKGTVGGQLTLSIGPTIAPYLLPKFIKHYRQSHPSVELTVKEMKADHMLEAILNGEIDAGIAAVLEKGHFILGEQVSGLEDALAPNDSTFISLKVAGANCRCSNPRTWSTRTCG